MMAMTMTPKRRIPVIPILLLVAIASFCGLWLKRFEGLSLGTPVPTAAPRPLSQEDIQAAIIQADKRRAELMKPDPALPTAEIRARWGIEVLGLHRAAAGRMLDFRYRVIDPQKAAPLFDSRIQPRLIDERSKVKIAVPNFPKIGALRTTNRGNNIQAGKIYTIMFGGGLRAGDTATVEIGDFTIEHLTVR